MSVRETEIVAIGPAESPVSSVSWAAVIAGALAAVATSLVLMLVGSGLGLTIVSSPWSGAGAAATTVAISAVIWLVVVQWLSSGIGGYLAGRLRKRWSGISGDEVTFRDTAHGFLAWALATVVVAAVLSSAVSAITGTAVQTAATIGGGAAQGAAQGAMQSATGSIADPTAYFVDTLFRKPAAPATAGSPAAGEATQTPAPATSAASSTAARPDEQGSGDVRAEAGRILVSGLAADEMPAADKAYLGQLVAEATGLAPADAEQRVDDVLAQVDAAKAQAKEAAEAARKAAATLAILMALALVVGAFIASVAAAIGGSQRDTI